MIVALAREVSPNIDQCELTYKDRESIDVDQAREQHENYLGCLRELGCTTECLPAESTLPDSVFVEDTCIVLDEIAIITRPGVASRRLETPSVAKALQPYRKLGFIEPPGTLDGGDVLEEGKSLYVGLSSRTNQEGMEQLQRNIAPFGYEVQGVPIRDCLHLKSAATVIAPSTLLINRERLSSPDLERMDLIEVDPLEPAAANALLVGETVVYSQDFIRTRQRMEDYGIRLRVVDISELRKAEAGITCCSVIFNA